MAIPFQAYTNDGTIQAHLAGSTRLLELLEARTPLTLELGRLGWLDGSAPTTFVRSEVVPDEILAAVAPPEQVVPSHAVWHALELEAGPWSICGRLPTLPGFDPGRALARPGGTFVMLAEVVVSAVPRARALAAAAPDAWPAQDGAGSPAHPFAFINRYTVERVTADIELGFFFPGARSTVHADEGPSGRFVVAPEDGPDGAKTTLPHEVAPTPDG